MSDKPAFCPFVPTDPLCLDKPDETTTDPTRPVDGGDKPTDPTDMNKMDGGDDHMMMDKADPLMGQLTFLGVALSHSIWAGANLFKYHHSDSYYSNGDLMTAGTTNYWKIGEELHEYAGLTIFGVISITQLLSTLGMFTEINMMAWAYGVMAYTIISMIADLILLWGKDVAFGKAEDTSSAASVVTAANATVTSINAALFEAEAFALANHMMEHQQHENWLIAQMINLCGEEMDDCPEGMKMDGKKMKDSDDKAGLFRQAYFGF